MNASPPLAADDTWSDPGAPHIEVRIEIPRGSFLKVGSSGEVDFVSPLPCPFNYGSVPDYVGLEGDLLDAVVLGPRLPAGTSVQVYAFGAVGLSDRGLYDDKLICARTRPGPWTRRAVIAFFHLYALAKRALNLWRGRPGLTRCEGWGDAGAAIGRAQPRPPGWRGPDVVF